MLHWEAILSSTISTSDLSFSFLDIFIVYSLMFLACEGRGGSFPPDAFPRMRRIASEFSADALHSWQYALQLFPSLRRLTASSTRRLDMRLDGQGTAQPLTVFTTQLSALAYTDVIHASVLFNYSFLVAAVMNVPPIPDAHCLAGPHSSPSVIRYLGL